MEKYNFMLKKLNIATIVIFIIIKFIINYY